MNNFKKTLISSLALILSLFGVANPVMADNNQSTLTVSPPHQQIILIPGETYEGSIRVSTPNEATTDLVYSVSINPFNQVAGSENSDEDNYSSVDTEMETNYNQIINWIILGKKGGSVPPNSSDTIPFTIIVPEDAPAGGQYAAIMVQDDTDRGNPDGNIMIESKTRIAAIIYAEVVGETRNEGSILENKIPSFLLSNTLDAFSSIKNDGNVHTNASYILQVYPLFSNDPICDNEEKPTTSLIMPETSKSHSETCNLPSIGFFRAKQTVKIFGEISIVEKTVIVCPLWLIFIVLFFIAFIIIWLVSRIKARKNK